MPDACELGHAVMKAGSIVFVGGKTRHGGGTNISGEARRAIATSFVLGWLRTQEILRSSKLGSGHNGPGSCWAMTFTHITMKR